MIAVSKAVFRKNPDEYFKKVEENGEELVVTHNKVPLFKVIPFKKNKSVRELFADVQGKIKYHGDILEPETEEWAEIS